MVLREFVHSNLALVSQFLTAISHFSVVGYERRAASAHKSR